MKPLDKKQIPQVVAMAILAVLFFGYFAVKMIMPTPAAAGTHAAPAATPAASPRGGAATPAAADPASAQLVAVPPTAALRDPFVPSVSDQPAPPPAAPRPVPAPAARPAALVKPTRPPSLPVFPVQGLTVKETRVADAGGRPVAVPTAPPLPPAPPAWVVTGILQSGTDTVAVLRSGDARRFVKQGDLVDSAFRVASVTRDAVVLKHGPRRFLLPLGGGKAVPSGPAARAVASPAAPGPAPASADFTLNTLAGRPVSLSSYRGRVVVLDFWASWCEWCRKGMPQVQTLYSRFASKGLAVLSVNSWDKRDAMQEFVRANPQYTTTMLFDPSPAAQSVAGGLFGVKGIPYTVVIDQKGRVAAAFDGYTDDGEQKLEAVLTRLGLRRAAPDIARAAGRRGHRSTPELARAVRPRLTSPRVAHPALIATAPRSLSSFAAPVLVMPLLPAPRPVRRAVRRVPACPVVRVADYQVEQAGVLFPAQGRGLLPSGMPAPDFSLSSLSGQDVTLSQFRGGVVVLDFWASWDARSVQTLAWLQGLQHEAGRDRLTVLAVDSWDSRGAMQSALQGTDWDLTVLFDPSVSNESVAVRGYRAPDIPTLYVIDPQGRVAGAFAGSGRNTPGSVKAVLAKLGVL